ncbi:P-loop containing nucleoside triphosphate hydrolase protein [Schizophyllum commune]
MTLTNVNGSTSSQAADFSEDELEAILLNTFKVPSLRPYQLLHSRQIAGGDNLFLIIATGKGKTLVLLSALVAAHARGENAVGVYIAPTKALVMQQASNAPVSLHPLAFNEDTVREAQANHRDLFRELRDGKGTRLAFMTPQMFCGLRFKELLRNSAFRASIACVSVDEAHLVDDLELGTYHAAYDKIRAMRTALPSRALWILASGSVTFSRQRLVASRFGLSRDHYILARYPLDRPNIKYTIRFMQHATSNDKQLDITFVIPPKVEKPQDIPRVIIFYSTFAKAYAAMCILDQLLPPDLPDRDRVTQMYGSIFSPEYKAQTLRDMQDPSSPLRVLIATDALIFGMDARGIYKIIIVDPTEGTLNRLKQQIGRIRDDDPAEAYILVPKFARILEKDGPLTAQETEDAERRKKMQSDLLRFLNAARTDYHDKDEDVVCPRALDCKLNNEPFPILERCCNKHSPDSVEDFETIAHWQKVLGAIGKDSKFPVRSDGTYASLSKDVAMQHELAGILSSWGRAAHAQEARGKKPSFLPSACQFPPSLWAALPAKAHLCSDLDRLRKVVCALLLPHSWRGFDFEKHGESLLEVIQRAMERFTKEIRARPAKSQPKIDKMKKDILKNLCAHYKMITTGGRKALAERLIARLNYVPRTDITDLPVEDLEAVQDILAQEAAGIEDASQTKVESTEMSMPLSPRSIIPAKRDVSPHSASQSSRPRPRPKPVRRSSAERQEKENNPDQFFIIDRQPNVR